MRKSLILIPILLTATPTLAQPAPSADPLPPELTNPRTADRVVDVVQDISQAVLDMRIGAVQAAVEGREATSAEKKMTVRDLGRKDNPNFDRDLNRQMAQVRPTIERGMKAVSTALPAMMKALDDVGRAVDRAAANMPDPTYPKR